MKSVTEMGPLVWALVLGLALLLGGCTAPAGGGDGDDGGEDGVQDPLPEYRLGEDAQLDADVAAITEADNAALECIDEDLRFEEEDVLLSLKEGYVDDPDPEGTFPEFVAEIVDLEQAKSDEICNTTLENASPELLAEIERLTTARNRGRDCRGEDPNLTDENSLLYLATKYLGQSAQFYPTMLDFAVPFVEEAEAIADGECI